MKLSEHKDLKKEILALPAKEKDKLLLRLVAKDKVLTEHLHFLLLEDEFELNQRVDNLKEEIATVTDDLATQPKLTAKDTLTSLRNLSKLVNHFYKVTKSVSFEIELKLLLLANAPTKFRYKARSAYGNYEDKYAIYFVKTLQATLVKFYKLHEDLQFDLSELALSVLDKANHAFASEAKMLGLPIALN